MTAPIAMSAKEVEASLSLLGMMQPEAVAVVTSSLSPPAEVALKQEGVHDALLRVVASQADALALTGGDVEVDGGCWTPRGFLKRNTQLTTLSRELSLDELRAHFGKPIVEVAKEFGICTTFLKKICRRCGIKRWPHRQIRSLQRTIQMLHQAEASALTPQERLKFSNQIAQLEAKKRAVIHDPDANGKLKRVKKCGAKNKSRRGGASEKSEDDVDMDASDDDDMDDEDDAMRLLEMAGAHQSATPEAAPKLDAVSESAVSPINGNGSLDASIASIAPIVIADTRSASPAAMSSSSPPSPSASTPTSADVKTPTASSKSKCSSPDENGSSSTSEPSGLKISPSNRKISLGTKKYDIAADSQRVRSSSLGSLQDETPEADPVVTEVTST